MGSDYPPALAGADSHGISGSGAGAQHLLLLMGSYFGNMRTLKTVGGTVQPATGIVASFLTRPLTGISGGIALSTYTQTGIQAWYNWLRTLLTTISAGCSE